MTTGSKNRRSRIRWNDAMASICDMLSSVGAFDTARLIEIVLTADPVSTSREFGPVALATMVVAVTGYVIGSIPAANLIARRHGIADLRHVGDKNPGYWNARSALGRREATWVFIADVTKGATAAAIGVVASLLLTSLLLDGAADSGSTWWWLGYVGAGAAMIGHALPMFDRFRGGRSVLTFVGGAIVVATTPALAAIGVLLVVIAITRRFDIAARAGVIAFPILQLFLEGPYRTAATGVLMTFIGLRFAQAAMTGRSGTDDPATAGSS
jgi:glycerol-3-phosphate acyltransferase PlsY